MRFDELERWEMCTDRCLEPREDGQWLKVEDVERLLRIVVLRLDHMDVSRMTTGHGESDEFVKAEPIKKIANMLRVPNAKSAVIHIGEVNIDEKKKGE